MPLRDVEPLEDEEWNILVDELQKEPDPKRVEFIQKAVASGQKFIVHR